MSAYRSVAVTDTHRIRLLGNLSLFSLNLKPIGRMAILGRTYAYFSFHKVVNEMPANPAVENTGLQSALAIPIRATLSDTLTATF
ncbi:hypothetical protein [Rhodoferax sp.]|uniref:hypothetical protein n=1 Tax=Rhodoferax sp. TaxID=50421 RepID=UPI0025E4773D|nr:hypothetical protein [Rhodoferax sp.]